MSEMAEIRDCERCIGEIGVLKNPRIGISVGRTVGSFEDNSMRFAHGRPARRPAHTDATSRPAPARSEISGIYATSRTGTIRRPRRSTCRNFPRFSMPHALPQDRLGCFDDAPANGSMAHLDSGRPPRIHPLAKLSGQSAPASGQRSSLWRGPPSGSRTRRPRFASGIDSVRSLRHPHDRALSSSRRPPRSRVLLPGTRCSPRLGSRLPKFLRRFTRSRHRQLTDLIESFTPLALESALEIQQQIEVRLHETDGLRQAEVERARYNAELARRRYNYTQIADSLNQRGLLSGSGKPFDSLPVGLICRTRQLKSRFQRLRARGLLTFRKSPLYFTSAPTRFATGPVTACFALTLTMIPMPASTNHPILNSIPSPKASNSAIVSLVQRMSNRSLRRCSMKRSSRCAGGLTRRSLSPRARSVFWHPAPMKAEKREL